MSEQNRPHGHHDQKRRAKREAVNALYFAVVEAIESAPEANEVPIEVPCAGISLEVVNSVIRRFEGSGWNVELNAETQKLSATAANIDNTHTPRPPRPPYTPPAPIVPTPPVQPIYEPGPNTPPPPGAGPNPGAIPPVVPPGREPDPVPPGHKNFRSEDL